MIHRNIFLSTSRATKLYSDFQAFNVIGYLARHGQLNFIARANRRDKIDAARKSRIKTIYNIRANFLAVSRIVKDFVNCSEGQWSEAN